MSGTVLGALSAAIVVGAGARWFQLLHQVRIPRDRTIYLALNGAAALIGIGALVMDTGLAGRILAGIGLLGGVTFIGLRLQSTQKAVTPAVAVGHPVINFAAPDDQGRPFDLASLRGKPFLLKFFRGHW